MREIPVLDRKLYERRPAACAKCFIQRHHLAYEDADRPAIGNDVMCIVKSIDMLCRVQSEQGDSQEQSAFYVEVTTCLFGCQPADSRFAPLAGEMSSITGRARASEGAITCIGTPLTALNAVRKISCRPIISLRLFSQRGNIKRAFQATAIGML